MGSFLANLHVRADHADALAVAEAAITALAARHGLAPVDDDADRTVVLVHADGWLSVYDEEADAQDQAALDELAATLGAALARPAFTVMVHDSDVLYLTLFDGGRKVDHYDSNPGYFGGRRKRGKPGPHVAAWHGRLGGAESALHAVFGADDLFAEAALEPLSRATGVPVDRLTVGYRYLPEQGTPAGAVTLRFGSPDAHPTAPSGPPRLRTDWQLAVEHFGAPETTPPAQPLQAAVGAEVRASLTARNLGGPGTGVRARVTGGDGLVAWSEVQLLVGDPRKTPAISAARPMPDDHGWSATFPDVALPAGAAALFSMTTPAEARRAIAARFASQVHVNIVGTATAPGRSTLALHLEPLHGDGTGVSCALVARSTDDRPLRAPATVHPTQLDPLEARSTLVLLAVLASDPGASIARIAAAIAPFVPTTGVVRTTRYPANEGGVLGALAAPPAAPRMSTGKASGFLTSRRWTRLLAALADHGQIDADWAADRETMATAARLSAGRGMIPSTGAVTAVTIALPPTDDAAAALAAAVDACAEDGLHQAVLTRWGAGCALDTTPYELAVGVHGQCTLEERWVTRWIRAVGPGSLWIGPGVQAQLDRGALAAAAPVRDVGSTWRVDVTDVPAVEAALAPALPSQADWQQGVMRMYGR